MLKQIDLVHLRTKMKGFKPRTGVVLKHSDDAPPRAMHTHTHPTTCVNVKSNSSFYLFMTHPHQTGYFNVPWCTITKRSH